MKEIRIIHEEGQMLGNVIEIYRWKTDDKKDEGHGYHIASLALNEMPCIILQLEMVKQKLIKDYEFLLSPNPGSSVKEIPRIKVEELMEKIVREN